MAQLIELRGYDTTAVHSYDEAVDLLERATFELAIIDCVMPGIGGIVLSRYHAQSDKGIWMT